MPDTPTDPRPARAAATPVDEGRAAPVPWPTLVHFGAPLVPAYMLFMMLTVVYMQFATDVLMLAPGVVGSIFFASKLWDAVSDPIVGFLSDRTRSRHGRRKPWMLGSILPMIALSIMLWSPPARLEGAAVVAWVAVSVIGFYTAFTIFAVPQMALGVELSPEPEQRARVFGSRQFAQTLGLLACFAIATPLVTGHADARANAAWIGTGAALVLALTTLVTTWALPRERQEYSGRGARNPFVATRDVVRNPHARLLLFVYFIEVFGIGATSAMTPFLLIYVTKATDWIGPVFLFYTVPAIASIPFWVRLAGRYERRKLWRVAMGLQAVGYGSMIFQDEGRVALMIAGSALNGFAGACGQTLGYAIKGDVIDYDEHQTGERKEGAYLAAWNLAAKFGTGLMVAFSGWALQGAGFVPNAEQTDVVKWTIRGMIGGAPFVCLLIGMVAFSRFSLGDAEAAAIRDEIARR